jgi:hypothetical protein
MKTVEGAPLRSELMENKSMSAEVSKLKAGYDETIDDDGTK